LICFRLPAASSQLSPDVRFLNWKLEAGSWKLKLFYFSASRFQDSAAREGA
jgi:hypothetical protein